MALDASGNFDIIEATGGFHNITGVDIALLEPNKRSTALNVTNLTGLTIGEVVFLNANDGASLFLESEL